MSSRIEEIIRSNNGGTGKPPSATYPQTEI